MSKKNKLSKTSKKVIFLTFIYLFILIAFLSPFIAIEGSNKTLGLIVAGIITLIYLLTLLVILRDWMKARVNLNDQDRGGTR